MEKRGHSARSRARDVVQAAITACRAQAATRLPTTVELAGRAKVSPVTMMRVLWEFREKGDLVLQHGSGIRLTAQARNPHDMPERVVHQRSLRWKEIRDVLQADIVNARFKTGSALPAIGELRLRFGAGYQVVRKALDSLQGDNLVQRHGRGYRTAGLPGLPGQNRLVLITGSAPDGTHLASSYRAQELLREFESACSRNGLLLEMGGWNGLQNRFTFGNISLSGLLSKQAHKNLGVIVLCQAMEQWKETEQFLISLCEFDGPIVFIDETGYCSRLPLPWLSPRLFRVNIGWSSQSGRAVGSHLAALGHRRVAYIAPLHGGTWSHNRLRGLQQAFAAPDAVVSFVNAEQAGIDHAVGASVELRHYVNTVMRSAQIQANQVHSVGSAVLEQMRLQYYPAVNVSLHRSIVQPLIKQACARDDIDTLVAATDMVGTEIRHYLSGLKRHHRLIAFDDSIAAVNERFSSYNFNLRAAVEYTLRVIVRPSENAKMRLFEPVGFVTDRGSLQQHTATC